MKINIAVIDDGINHKNILEYHPEFDIELTNKLKTKQRPIIEGYLNHATICTAIILKYAQSANIGSIKILDTKSHKGTINQLVRSLYWCVENNIKLVNLSLGSIDYHDIDLVKKCINDVTAKGLIVIAALNNKNVFTLPASLSEVIGVRCNQSLVNGQYNFIKDSLYGVDINASGRHKLDNLCVGEFVTQGTNSYAAPLITAYDYNILKENCNLDFKEIKTSLFRKSDNYSKGFYHANYEESEMSAKAKIEIPILLFYSLLPLAKEISDRFREDGYFSIFISDKMDQLDPISEYIPYNIDIEKYISDINQKYNCDVIICSVSAQLLFNNIINCFNFDMIVSSAIDRSPTRKKAP